jgi:hypothetical protein
MAVIWRSFRADALESDQVWLADMKRNLTVHLGAIVLGKAYADPAVSPKAESGNVVVSVGGLKAGNALLGEEALGIGREARLLTEFQMTSPDFRSGIYCSSGVCVSEIIEVVARYVGLTLTSFFSKMVWSYSPETLPPRNEPPTETPRSVLRCS